MVEKQLKLLAYTEFELLYNCPSFRQRSDVEKLNNDSVPGKINDVL